jgi:MFS transporter, ACS family, D-galactonate transporter
MTVMNAPDSVTAEAEKPSSTRWAILALLAVGAVIAFVSRTNVASALTIPAFIEQFGLADIDRGTVNSAFFWSYAVMQIPMGWVVDRYGVKIPYAICFLTWCLASAATGMMTTLYGLIAMRLVVGAAEGVVVPASYRWIRHHFSESESGFAVGIYMLGTKLGPALGAPLAVWLIQAYDWRLMFLIAGLAGVIWLAPWMLFVENDSKKGAALPGAKRKNPSVSLGSILSSPLVWGTIIINYCYNYFTFYCMTWMPAYLVEARHLSLKEMSLYSFFSFLGIAIVALAAGWIADIMIKRGGDPVIVRKAFVLAGFAVACTELFGGLTDSLDWALFWNVVSLSGLGLATANHLALCRLTLIPKPAVGLVTGVQNVSTSLAGIVAPILSGWLKQVGGGYELPMQVIFVFMLLGGVTCVVLLRRKYAPVVSDFEPSK